MSDLTVDAIEEIRKDDGELFMNLFWVWNLIVMVLEIIFFLIQKLFCFLFLEHINPKYIL